MGNTSSRVVRQGAGLRRKRKGGSGTSRLDPQAGQETDGPGALAQQGASNTFPNADSEIKVTTPELPEGEIVNSLFGMISSRTETFAGEAEKLRQVPSKSVNEERKLHRLETRDIRQLMEKVSRGQYKDVRSLSREFNNVPEDVLASVIEFSTLPAIERSIDGRLVEKK